MAVTVAAVAVVEAAAAIDWAVVAAARVAEAAWAGRALGEAGTLDRAPCRALAAVEVAAWAAMAAAPAEAAKAVAAYRPRRRRSTEAARAAQSCCARRC